jgi:hypothetical protein
VSADEKLSLEKTGASMALNIEAHWQRPIELKLARTSAIYECDLDALPDGAGVYVFGRKHGGSIAPLYIGRTLNLRRRIEQQLNSVKLMMRIRGSQSGARLLVYCEPRLKQRQKVLSVIRIIESALISHALAANYELLQKQGTKTPNHMISFTGNRTSEQIAPRRMRVAVKGLS